MLRLSKRNHGCRDSGDGFAYGCDRGELPRCVLRRERPGPGEDPAVDDEQGLDAPIDDMLPAGQSPNTLYRDSLLSTDPIAFPELVALVWMVRVRTGAVRLRV